MADQRHVNFSKQSQSFDRPRFAKDLRLIAAVSPSVSITLSPQNAMLLARALEAEPKVETVVMVHQVEKPFRKAEVFWWTFMLGCWALTYIAIPAQIVARWLQ